MTTKDEALQISLSSVRKRKTDAEDKRRGEWNALSKNVFDDDLGFFSDSIEYDYELDNATRDRLIAHARQDVAMNYMAISDTFKLAHSAKLYSLLAMVFAFVGMIVSIINLN